ncbi:nuclease-related domain-containing DEAD/DEAH box helicase [Nocardioides stalactiti]|uniref:nuclease-related domain-containing DEAD/DEAH box helicase n=1 Tax=Nocardioides stalactiti TaxID=2755356 RepID=UPI001601D0D9|nr:nuclease-related domain-containing DEAD/DEAH box helicase [Nocardioides stalactiti]
MSEWSDAPRFATASERDVWQQLRDTLPDDCLILANLRLTDELKDHEVDLLVLLPDVGCIVLEVKGGSVWTTTADRGDVAWWSRSGGKERRIHPVDQIRDGKHALRHYVENDPRWGSRGPVAWAHGVVTPYSEFDADFQLPDLPRWSLHDRNDVADLAGRVHRNARRMTQGRRPPTGDDVDLIAEILGGRLHASYDVNAEADDRAATSDRLTQEQATILGVTRLINRVEIRGGAGSGKTVLALRQAKELSLGMRGKKAERVALLCYSIGLAEHFKRVTATWRRQERPAFVGTFEELGRTWGAPSGTREDSAFWEEELPALMAGLAAELPDGKRFDSIVVDEAQDFADNWWQPLLRSLRSDEDGGIYVFSDEHQRVFSRFGRPPVQLVPLVLDHCLRNTRQVFEAFGSMAPSRMYARGGDGPDVTFVPCETEDAIDVADLEVLKLLDEGWRDGSIALITTGHRHPSQVDLVEGLGHERYWDAYFAQEDVFFGHVLGCKGLERPAVVLCLNEDGNRDRARERLYVGMSRATDRLVVVGDPDVVRRVGGPEVARRLGA